MVKTLDGICEIIITGFKFPCFVEKYRQEIGIESYDSCFEIQVNLVAKMRLMIQDSATFVGVSLLE